MFNPKRIFDEPTESVTCHRCNGKGHYKILKLIKVKCLVCKGYGTLLCFPNLNRKLSLVDYGELIRNPTKIRKFYSNVEEFQENQQPWWKLIFKRSFVPLAGDGTTDAPPPKGKVKR